MLHRQCRNCKTFSTDQSSQLDENLRDGAKTELLVLKYHWCYNGPAYLKKLFGDTRQSNPISTSSNIWKINQKRKYATFRNVVYLRFWYIFQIIFGAPIPGIEAAHPVTKFCILPCSVKFAIFLFWSEFSFFLGWVLSKNFEIWKMSNLTCNVMFQICVERIFMFLLSSFYFHWRCALNFEN